MIKKIFLLFTSNTGKFSGAPNSIYILGIELRKKDMMSSSPYQTKIVFTTN